ncbi:MAG: creatininase family protein [Deltaproteobacteria bacterium]|nr:creatininase family protein [Deltaproteobacteria bacterium]
MGEKRSQGYSIFHETMADMTWPDIKKAAENGAIILLPTGVIEEHGPHMCLGVDTYEAYMFARIVKEKLESKGVETLIVPPFYWGITAFCGAYPGSFTCRPETVKAVYYDILDCLNEWGFKHVFAFTLHQEPNHGRMIMEAMKEGQSSIGIKAYYLIWPGSKHASRFGLSGKEEYVFNVPSPPPEGPPPEFADVHAGKGETGIMMAYFPDLVDPEMAKTLEANKRSFKELAKWGKLSPESLRKFMGQGYIGDPANFDPASGKNWMEDKSDRTADAIDSFLKGTFEPPEVK